MAMALSRGSSLWVLGVLGADGSPFLGADGWWSVVVAHATLHLATLSLWHRVLDAFFTLVEPRPRAEAAKDLYGSVVAQMMLERSVLGGQLGNNVDGAR